MTGHLPLCIMLDIENHKIKVVNKIKKNKMTILIIKIKY